MGLELSKASLLSHVARVAINNAGGRKFNPGAALETQQDQDGNILSAIWNIGKQLVGFLAKSAAAITGFVFSFAGLVGQIVNAVRFVWSYNLATPDAQIDNQIRGLWNAFIPRLGGAFGQALGWFTCGFVPGVALFKFNKALGAKVLAEVGEEAFDEMMSTLKSMGAATVQATFQSFFLKMFKSVRKWLKRPGNPLYNLLPAGLKAAWQTNTPWSFAKAVEAKVESLPAGWEEFAEEALEEFGDACTEALFLVASSVDVWLAEQNSKVTSSLGDDFVIEVFPNRDEPESFLMAGPIELLKESIPVEIQNRQYLGDKDLGMQLDEEARTILLAAQPFSLYGWVVFRSEDGKGPGRRPTYQLPAFDRAKVDDYDRIRAACGGPNGYLWGRFVATATTSVGHPLIVRGGTADDAEDRLEALATLCELDLLTVNVTDERRTHKRASNPTLKKDTRRVLPYRLILVNRHYFTDPRPNAQPSKNGYYDEVRFVFDISGSTKPSDWNARMAEVLLGPTAANP
jgi:hypothetical protein